MFISKKRRDTGRRDNRINRNVSKLYLKYRIAQNVRRVVSENLQRSISINEINLRAYLVRTLDNVRSEKGFLKRLGKSDVGGNNSSRLVKYSRRRSSSSTRSRRYVDEPTRTLRDATRGQILCGAS